MTSHRLCKLLSRWHNKSDHISGDSMRLSSALLLVLSASIVSLSQDSAKPFTFDGKSWWQHVKVLADDNMEGRDTGSEGLRRASAYVIEQIKKDGLQPAGTDGYLQSVKFRERRLDEAQSSLSLVRDGKEQPLVIGDDAIFS